MCEGRDLPRDTAVKVSLFSLNFREKEKSENDERVAAVTVLCVGAPRDTPATPLRQRHKEPSRV